MLSDQAVRLSIDRTECLTLLVVVGKNEFCDLIRHVPQNLFALLVSHVTVADDLIEQDFDVDLVIRAIHAA